MGIVNDIKQRVLNVAQNAFKQGLFAGTSGNLSVYIKEEGCVVITPSSIRYETMRVDDLVVIDLEGNVIEGYNKPSSEWQMHCLVYKKCDFVSSVFHTHSPYATSFAVNGIEIPMFLIEMLPFLGGSIPVAGVALPGTEEMGEKAIGFFKDRNACLLSNHGVLTIGDSVEQAHIRAEYVEDAAKIYHYALLNGEIKDIPKELIEQMEERIRLRKKQQGGK